MGEREESLALHPNEGRGPDRNSTVMCKCSEETSILTVNPLGKRSETKQDAQYGVDLCKLRGFGVGGAMAATSRIVKPRLDGVCVHCSRLRGCIADSQAAQPASYPFHQRPFVSSVLCFHSHLDPHGGFDVYVYGPVWIRPASGWVGVLRDGVGPTCHIICHSGPTPPRSTPTHPDAGRIQAGP